MVFSRGAAAQFQCLRGCHQYAFGRAATRPCGTDVKEFFGAEVGGEPWLRLPHNRQTAGAVLVAISELQPWAILAKGPP